MPSNPFLQQIGNEQSISRASSVLVEQTCLPVGRTNLGFGKSIGFLSWTAVALIVGYLLAQAIDFGWLTDYVNLAGPMILGSVAVINGIQLVRRQPLAVWTPYAWFLGGVFLYYSLGPLVYVLGGVEVRDYVETSLPIAVTPGDLLRTNLLNAVGVFCILLGMSGARMVWAGPKRYNPMDRGGLERIKAVTLWLLLIGGALQYLLILPWEFGAYDFVLPGVIYNLGKLFLFGLLGLAYVVTRGRHRWRWLLYALWFFQVLASIIHFSKTELVLSLILPMLGMYLANNNIKRLLFGALITAVAYVAVAQFIHYGRAEVIDLSGNMSQATIGERLNILDRWMGEDSKTHEFAGPELSNAEKGWARLSYANVQTFAMDRYDAGYPGDSLKTALIVLIPRILWPDKPVTTDMAVEFYRLVKGWEGDTHLGLGLFGEGYWNFGWIGVALVSMATGMAYWVISMFAMHWMRGVAIEYMPGIFLGISMGILGTTQLFANAVVGASGLIAFYALFVSKALHVMARRPG